MAAPCVFFDRDGIVNDCRDYYVLTPERFFINESFLKALALVNAAGWKAIIVTNQKCLSKGLLTEEGLGSIHEVLLKIVVERDLVLDAIYFARGPEGDPDLKPEPGMLLQAAMEYDLDLARSIMIGDKERDVVCGMRAGCAQNVLVNEKKAPTVATHQVASMERLVSLLPELLRGAFQY